MTGSDIERLFPGLVGTQYHRTSPNDQRYNCVAWAMGDDSRWWWPDDLSYWPAGAEIEETLDAFVSAFQTIGYSTDPIPEPYDCIAIFADDQNRPRHVARRLPTGRWTSKLGELVDIEHDLAALAGLEYGSVAKLLYRTIRP